MNKTMNGNMSESKDLKAQKCLADDDNSSGSTSTSDELQKISEFFELNVGPIEKWLNEKASSEVIERIHAITTKQKEKLKDHRPSVTSELYQQWLSSSTAPTKVSFWNENLMSFKM